MQALILAAGMGKRLGNLTRNNTKCMVEVNGVKLIDRVLTQLSRLGLTRVVIVVGYEGRKLMDYIGTGYKGLSVEYVENPIYDKTNNIYSLALAKDKLQEDDTLLIESDLIFDDALLPLIARHPYPDLAMVAKYETWMDGTMVRIDEDNRIVSFVPKEAFRYEDVGEYYKTVNVYKFSKAFSSTEYVPFLEAYCKMMGNNEYYEQVLRVLTILNRTTLRALPIDKERWYEIDDVQDLDIASTLFAEDKAKYEEYHKRYGGYWRFPNLMDYSSLSNPFFPTKRMRDEMRANFDILLTEYPSAQWVNSLLAGKHFGVRQDYIVLGNGAAELIKTVMEKHTGNKVGVVYPTFDEYPNRLRLEQIVPFVPFRADFRYTADDLMAFYGENPVSLLLLINPDNPSGNFIAKEDVLRLAAWCRERQTQLVVDESFVDFSVGSAGNTLLNDALLESHPNMMVLKSVGNSHGVPGLRLGVFASCDRPLIAKMKKEVPIWNINSFGEFYMQIFGKYEKDYQRACKKFVEERDTFYEELCTIPYLHPMPSQANYFLCEVTGKYTSAGLTQALINRDVIVSDCGRKCHIEGKNLIQLAVRDHADNSKLIQILKSL